MTDGESSTVIMGVFGALVTVIQALGLWILGDIRRRVERLEGVFMKGERRASPRQ